MILAAAHERIACYVAEFTRGPWRLGRERSDHLQVLDVGCGVGGPLRSICAFSGAAVVGLNNNEYQARPGRCPPLRSASLFLLRLQALARLQTSLILLSIHLLVVLEPTASPSRLRAARDWLFLDIPD